MYVSPQTRPLVVNNVSAKITDDRMSINTPYSQDKTMRIKDNKYLVGLIG